MKKILLLLAIPLFMGASCTMNSNNQPPTQNKIDIDETVLSGNPQACNQAEDCVAINNPSNPCYKAYFNKDSTDAIEEYKNTKNMMKQDCPQFGPAVCLDNKCQAEYIK